MRRVVHFEIPADDLTRAKGFYGSVFGWQLMTMPMSGGEYTTATTTPTDGQTQIPTEPGAINGGLVQRDQRQPAPVITIQVDAIDDALAEIEAGGGSMVTPRTAIPGMGAFAYFKDPEGNVLGLWRPPTNHHTPGDLLPFARRAATMGSKASPLGIGDDRGAVDRLPGERIATAGRNGDPCSRPSQPAWRK